MRPFYLNAGHYVGLEPNRWLVEEGLAKEVGASLVESKLPSFFFSDSAQVLNRDPPFDFAVAQSIFSHCGSDLLSQWLRDIVPLLKPTGALVATCLVGDADHEEQGWVYPGCVRYPLESMGLYARRYRFAFRLLDWHHPRQTWALFAMPGFDVSWFADRPLNWNTWLDLAPK